MAATTLHITLDELRTLELKRTRDARRKRTADRCGLPDLTLGETCYVMRRRIGWTIRRMAFERKVSHMAVIKWERDDGNVTKYHAFLCLLTEEIGG